MADTSRINRLVGILSLIDKGSRVTPRSLAEHFGVSEQTIYRDMRVLVIDYPIRFDSEHGSYRFADGYSLKKIDLTKNEIKAVLASKAILQKLGTGISTAFDGLVKKVQDEASCRTGKRLAGAGQQYWFDIDPVADFQAIQQQFDVIQCAIEEHVRVAIEYTTMHDQKTTSRQIDPYGLFYSSGVWYTLAYCHLRNETRTFALDRIKNIETTDIPFAVPKGFSIDKYFEGGWRILKNGEPLAIKLWFSAAVARWVMRRKWHPSQQIKKNADGSIVFNVTVNGTEELRRWIYHWGINCRVLSPAYLRKEVAAELNAMAKMYSK